VLTVRRSEQVPITRCRNLPAAREKNGAHRLVQVTTLGAVDHWRGSGGRATADASEA
jgi:hypothetical protein